MHIEPGELPKLKKQRRRHFPVHSSQRCFLAWGRDGRGGCAVAWGGSCAPEGSQRWPATFIINAPSLGGALCTNKNVAVSLPLPPPLGALVAAARVRLLGMQAHLGPGAHPRDPQRLVNAHCPWALPFCVKALCGMKLQLKHPNMNKTEGQNPQASPNGAKIPK